MWHLGCSTIAKRDRRAARRVLSAAALAALALATGVPFDAVLSPNMRSFSISDMSFDYSAQAGRRGRRESRESRQEDRNSHSDGSNSNSGFSASPEPSSSNSSSANSAGNRDNSPAPANVRSGDNGSGRWRGNDSNSDSRGKTPPRTLADLIDDWSKPTPAQSGRQKPDRREDDWHRQRHSAQSHPDSSSATPGAERGPGASPGKRPPDNAATPSSKRPASPVRSPGAPLAASGWSGEIGRGNTSNSEILAVRMSPQAVAKLTSLGFSVPPQPKSSSGVTRVYVPFGLDAVQAQQLLQKELPKEKFELNKLYRVYRAANRASSGAAYGIVPANQKLVCTGNRCASRDIIGWSGDMLRACSSGVAVGILDTGIDHTHPAIRDRSSGVFVPEGRTPAPTWHGTAVFALLAGNPRGGTPGLIPNADIYHASIFFSDQSGDFATDTAVILQALDWMEKMNVKIVNMSFAGPHDKLVEQAIKRLSAKGMIFIAAAGNEGPGADPAYPAAYREVIAVTAIKPDRRVYPYANRGRHIDVAAPGVDVWSAVPDAREGYFTGTSFAAPFVTALVATIYKSNPTSAKERVLAQFQYDDLGIPGRDSTYGRGLPSAPKTCAPPAHVASSPPSAPGWGTTTIHASPSAAPSLSAGFRH